MYFFLLRFLSGEKHHNSHTKKNNTYKNKNTKVKRIFESRTRNVWKLFILNRKWKRARNCFWERERASGFRLSWVHMCLPKKILKWCSNHAKKHLRSKFKILCSVHSITIKINFNIFYHKIKALWIFIMCGLSKCLIRMKNNSASGIAQWRKIYLLLKMFGGHNTLLADALDGGKTRDFVNVLKGKKITWSRQQTVYSVNHLLVLSSQKHTYVVKAPKQKSKA